MRPLAVVVLTQDEERTLPDCLTSLKGLEADVWVVDSGSTDRTVEIARRAGCEVVHHPFETYAAQRNWAFDHLPIGSPWTLCLDADERLTAALAAEIRAIVGDPGADGPVGYVMSRRTIFMGRWIRHGGQYPTYHLRLFRTGRGRCEDRRYDQHFVVSGPTGRLRHDFVDVLTSDLTAWTARHNRWASLEADQQLHERSGTTGGPRVEPRLLGDTIQRRRFWRSTVYRRVPLFVRPWLLWLYAYVIRLGFLDGLPGLIFHTLQKFWFRFLIDAKIYEAKLRARD
ncbi:MAG: glycosyltransferase family 2 protein [Geminicoccaceae bacterium]|nr:glycosyltransferase family 2 protein [Geminicoccaceae bacterium]